MKESKSYDHPQLEYDCPDCCGYGYTYQSSRKKINCENCGGNGKIISEFGKIMLDFLKYWKPWRNDIDDIKPDRNKIY